MKTQYVQTNFLEINDSIREQYRIKGRAQGVNLIPLAIGESLPGEEPDVEPEEERRSFFSSFRSQDGEDGEW